MTPITSVKDNIYTLTFSWKGELENYFDYLDINYSLDGSSWDWVDYRTGSTSGDFESDSSEDLTSIAESYDEFYFGFGITADSSVTSEGVSIDDIELTRTPLRISSYGYSSYNGTSMAAPHVAGVAGLVKALHPEFSNLQIRSAIINSVDVKADLVGSIATGGRLNAYGALVETNIDVISDGSGDSETVVVPGSNSGIVEAAAGGGGGGGG
ncbi:S8 family serine peptidase, partial [bacterium]|nr:S8 family serine peptidase [bacterium]